MIKAKTREEWIMEFRGELPSERASKAVDAIMELQADLILAKRCISLFSSMISSGEHHSEESIKMLEAAMGAKRVAPPLNNLD